MVMLGWLEHLVAPLNTVVFILGNDHVSWAEILGFVTGAAGVWLTVKCHIANFPIGIANSAFFLILFATSRLWADSGLQIIYIVLGAVGWWQWLHGGPSRARLIVCRTPRWAFVLGAAFIIFGTWGLTIVLGAAKDIAPFWDALTTCLSLVAQALLNWKKIETWYFWIAADVIYVPLYVVKKLDLTAIVYVLFLSICFIGLRQWKQIERDEHEHDPDLLIPQPQIA
jgi:nicotinamide mononucleotide transporter